jgi:IclR family transcriptional regulator, KDG regulon repressor
MSRSKAAEVILDILSLYNSETEELGLSEIGRKLNLYPSKIHRLFMPLVRGGLLEQNPVSRKYRLGIKNFELGMLYISQNALRKITRPHMEALARKLTTNVCLAILRNHNAMIIDNIQQWHLGSLLHLITINVPLHSSAVGKVLLAHLPEEQQKKLLNSMSLQRLTKRTITQSSLLDKELKKVNQQGYAFDFGETYDVLNSIASPIMDKNGAVLAAMSLDDKNTRLTKRKSQQFLSELMYTTNFISKQLGYESF